MNLSEKRSDQLGLAIIGTLLVFILFLLANVGWSSNLDESNNASITVMGEGRAFAVPDTATFTYTLRGEGDSAQAAQAAISADSAAVLDALEAQGVAETDIKTQYYNVSPRYEYREVRDTFINPPQGPRVLVGYEAIQTNQVRVRNVDSAGELLGLATDAGATDVSSLDFIVWDETAVESEARSDAIADARSKADELADQLGVRLGDIISFSESSRGNYPIAYDARLEMAEDQAMGGAAANISVGENEVNKTVEITFEIK